MEMLERLGRGVRIYVGAFVTAEVERRQLPPTPQSERQVGAELREEGGVAALARLALPTIDAIRRAGRMPLIDAIYCAEEYELYRATFEGAIVRLAISAPRPERVARLAARNLRRIDELELAERDAFEFERLGLESVMSAAEHALTNDGRLIDLEATLKLLPFGA